MLIINQRSRFIHLIKGYDLSHNFGHGKQHLSSLLARLNILAFLFHTVLALCDRNDQCLRDALPRKTFSSEIALLAGARCPKEWAVTTALIPHDPVFFAW